MKWLFSSLLYFKIDELNKKIQKYILKNPSTENTNIPNMNPLSALQFLKIHAFFFQFTEHLNISFVTTGPRDRPISCSTTCSRAQFPQSSHGVQETERPAPGEDTDAERNARPRRRGGKRQGAEPSRGTDNTKSLLHRLFCYTAIEQGEERGCGGRGQRLERTQCFSSFTFPRCAQTQGARRKRRERHVSDVSPSPQLHNFGVSLGLLPARDPSGSY